MPDRVWWPIIEHDQNRPRVFDVVTANHAEDLAIGDRVLIVSSEYAHRSTNDGRPIPTLDWGWATWGRVTDIKPTNTDPNLFIIHAEFDDEHSVSDG